MTRITFPTRASRIGGQIVGADMEWARILAYITGTVDQDGSIAGHGSDPAPCPARAQRSAFGGGAFVWRGNQMRPVVSSGAV
jgi:hypothetical protein